ncbi:MAG TPA: SlyX family protein [Steroidobacteraceae bacterium]
MSSEQLELMQTKIAYLERATGELSDVIFRQDREIQLLASQLKALVQRIETVDERARTPEEERPPHY